MEPSGSGCGVGDVLRRFGGVADEAGLGVGAVLADEPHQRRLLAAPLLRLPAGSPHWKLHPQLLPEAGRQLLGLVPLPVDQRQRHAGPPQLPHQALPLDGPVLDQDDPQVAAQRHAVDAGLQLQQRLRAPRGVAGADHHQEAPAASHEAQRLVCDGCNGRWRDEGVKG